MSDDDQVSPENATYPYLKRSLNMPRSVSPEGQHFCTVVKLTVSKGGHQKSGALCICFGLAEGSVEPESQEEADADPHRVVLHRVISRALHRVV